MIGSIMRHIAAGYLRRRHTLGFGVHSPLAFRLVRSVLQSTYEYYAYPSIEEAIPTDASGYGKRKRRARLIHRLCSRFPREHVVIDGSTTPEIAAAIQYALSRAKVTIEPAEVPAIYILSRNCEISFHDGDILLLSDTDKETIDRIWNNLEAGVMLYDKISVLVVVDNSVAKVKYSVRL